MYYLQISLFGIHKVALNFQLISVKSVSCPLGGEKIGQSGGCFFFAFPNLFVPFFDVGGGGVPVFRKYTHLFKVSNKKILRP